MTHQTLDRRGFLKWGAGCTAALTPVCYMTGRAFNRLEFP